MSVLYPGSYKPFEEGISLFNTSPEVFAANWSGAGFYETLERYRPEGRLAHNRAVFACDNIKDIDHAGGAAGEDAYVLTVEPVGEVSQHDVNWTTAIARVWNDRPDSPETEAHLKELARGYWSGEPFPGSEPVWEYLMPEATVLQCQEYDNAEEWQGPARPSFGM